MRTDAYANAKAPVILPRAVAYFIENNWRMAQPLKEEP